MTLLAALLSALLAQAAPANEKASDPSVGRNSERTALPAPGIIEGTAKGLEGGRTDKGPDGRTGIGERVADPSRAMHKKDASLRGRNAPGSFDRPAETDADINRDPKPMGSGADLGGLPQEGRNYPVSETQHGQAGGIASGKGSPGGGSRHGSAGKGAANQPEDHSSGHPDTPDGPNH